MARDYDRLVKDIYAVVGPAENILKATNCMTRLRLTLRDIPADGETALKKISGVLGVNVAADELQIILGPGHAAKAGTAMNQLLAAARTAPPPEKSAAENLAARGEEIHRAIKAKNDTPLKNFSGNWPRYSFRSSPCSSRAVSSPAVPECF